MDQRSKVKDAQDPFQSNLWLEDFLGLLEAQKFASESDTKDALISRLHSRYPVEMAERMFHSLLSSYNFLVQNWDYFNEVGLTRMEGEKRAFENCLLYAMRDFTANAEGCGQTAYADTGPLELVKLAQNYINQARN